MAEVYAATVHLVDGRSISQQASGAGIKGVTEALVSGNWFKFGDDRITVYVNSANVTTFEYHLYG